MSNHDKVWIDFWGSKRKGSHIHHIKARCHGGGDVIGNLIELHPDDHVLIHEMKGDKLVNGKFIMSSPPMGLFGDRSEAQLAGNKSTSKKRMGWTKDNHEGTRIMSEKAVERCKNPTNEMMKARKEHSEMMMGHSHSSSTKQLMKQKALLLEKLTCEHCGKQSDPGNFKRWHGDKCKNREEDNDN